MSKRIPAPSSCLPPLKRLTDFDAAEVTTLLGHLREIYQPEVNGIRSKANKTPHDSGYASEASDDSDDSRSTTSSTSSIHALRTDRFERSVAMKWLTGFVTRGEEWVEEGPTGEEQNERIRVTEDAASLLALCSGTSSGPLMRTFEFPRSPDQGAADEYPIVLHIRDASILSQDHTSVGLQTWGASCILAQKLVDSPAAFGLQQRSVGKPLRILDLGAGTGVLSMVMAKLFTSDEAEVVATDYHPAVLANLRANVSGNFDGALSSESHPPPTVLPLDWRHLHCIASSSAIRDTKPEAPFDMPFDIIIGADIIYEPEHALWIKSSVELLLKEDKDSFFHLIMPTRPTHEVETASVREAFPMAADVPKDETAAKKTIAILDVSEFDRMVGTGRMDEVRYLLYRIGWV